MSYDTTDLGMGGGSDPTVASLLGARGEVSGSAASLCASLLASAGPQQLCASRTP